MARQVLPIVGAVVGAFFGVPQLGFAIGSIVGNLVDPVINQGPKMGELPVQTSNEGMPRAIIYGTSTCTGYILCFGPPLKTTEIQTGEKGAPKTEVEVVYRSYAIAICEGPIAALLRVWENDKLVYDVRAESTMLAESAKWIANKALYLGGEEQLPDTFLQLNVSGVGITPAYRGTAYMVFGLEDLTDTQGAIKQYRWEVTKSGELGTSVIVSRGAEGTVQSPDGVDWENSSSGNNIPYLFSVGHRFIGVSTLDGRPQYSDDNGVTWSTATGDSMGGAGGQRIGWSLNNTVIVPCGIVKMLRSTDAGQSYTEIVGAPDSNLVATVGETQWISYYQGDLSFSNDDGLTWVFSATIAAKAAFGNGRGVGEDETMIGGTNSGNTLPIVCKITADPDDPEAPPIVGTETLPTIAGTPAITEIVFGDVWVAASYDGSLIAKIGGTWTVTGYLGVPATGLAWNGALYIAAGMDVDHGVIMTSPDGETWTVAIDQPVAGGLENWGDVAALLPTGTHEPVSLASIVADQHDRARIILGNYDVTELEDTPVLGMTITGDYTAADTINTLRSCFNFDKAEPGDKLYYPMRGKPVVETLTFDDLVDVPDLSRREQMSEVPKKLHLHALNPRAGYAPVKATYERSSVDVQAVAETTISVPVVMEVDEQQQMVHKMFKVLTTDAQGEIKLSIPYKFIRLIPSDCVGLFLRDQLLRLRIDESELQEGVMGLTLRRDRQSAYTSNLTGIEIPIPEAPPSTLVGETVFAIMDMSARQDSEDDLHILVAGTGASDGWPGWALQRSLDGGANWTTIDTYNFASTIGTLEDDVPDADENVTDTTNTVRVSLVRSTQALESITESQFLSEGGACAIEKDDGTWEVMQYLDAVEDSNGIFELSTLHRGRLNSGTSAHTAGARFVLLSTAEHVVMESSMIGQSVMWRGVSLGASVESADVETQTYVGRSQTEWPVASLSLSRNVSTNVVSGSWAPRFRFGTDDAPVNSINMTGFRITIVGSSTVVLPDQTANTFSYDASALGASVTVSVQALNRITGAGPATSGTV